MTGEQGERGEGRGRKEGREGRRGGEWEGGGGEGGEEGEEEGGRQRKWRMKRKSLALYSASYPSPSFLPERHLTMLMTRGEMNVLLE